MDRSRASPSINFKLISADGGKMGGGNVARGTKKSTDGVMMMMTGLCHFAGILLF